MFFYYKELNILNKNEVKMSGLTLWFVIKFIIEFAFLNLLSFFISSALVQRIINKLEDKDKNELLSFFVEMNKDARKNITKTERKIAPALIFLPAYSTGINLITVILIYKNKTKIGIIRAVHFASKFRICNMGRTEFCKKYIDKYS